METLFTMGHLLDFYGGLLTEKQRTIAQYSYHQDLSLSEVSAIMGITKQAVSETLSRARTALLHHEEVLGLRNRFYTLESEVERIAQEIHAIGEEVQKAEVKSRLERVETRLLALSLEEDVEGGIR